MARKRNCRRVRVLRSGQGRPRARHVDDAGGDSIRLSAHAARDARLAVSHRRSFGHVAHHGHVLVPYANCG